MDGLDALLCLLLFHYNDILHDSSFLFEFFLYQCSLIDVLKYEFLSISDKSAFLIHQWYFACGIRSCAHAFEMNFCFSCFRRPRRRRLSLLFRIFTRYRVCVKPTFSYLKIIGAVIQYTLSKIAMHLIRFSSGFFFLIYFVFFDSPVQFYSLNIENMCWFFSFVWSVFVTEMFGEQKRKSRWKMKSSPHVNIIQSAREKCI